MCIYINIYSHGNKRCKASCISRGCSLTSLAFHRSTDGMSFGRDCICMCDATRDVCCSVLQRALQCELQRDVARLPPQHRQGVVLGEPAYVCVMQRVMCVAKCVAACVAVRVAVWRRLPSTVAPTGCRFGRTWMCICVAVAMCVAACVAVWVAECVAVCVASVISAHRSPDGMSCGRDCICICNAVCVAVCVAVWVAECVAVWVAVVLSAHCSTDGMWGGFGW